MIFYIKNIKEEDCESDALILPFIEGNYKFYGHFKPSFQQLINKIFSKEFSGKEGELILVPAPDNIKPERILFVGLGKKDDISPEKIRQAGGNSLRFLRDKGMKHLALSTSILNSLNQKPADFIEGALLGLYTFKKYFEKKDNKSLKSIIILSKNNKALRDELEWVRAVTSSVYFSRDLINTPANDMTPKRLADTALTLKNKKLIVKILDKKDVQRIGMGAYLAVAKGSKEPLKFIILEHKGSHKQPIVLIGKSITFDSGGLSLKPPEGMEKMKYDMAGGAAVLGVMKSVSTLKIPIHIIGILPATENLPGGSATKPGDVVKTITGKTIEITNTDAEGRLTLADAIEYAMRYKPRYIIDIATLTGACTIAFGNEAIAMMGNDKYLMDKLKQAGEKTYERVWEMPIFEEYKEYLKSDVADLKNSGGRNGSLVSSAYFLYKFVNNIPWVHLDIAGTAWIEKDKPYIPKGATGVGIRLIMNLLKDIK